ncbi:MAG TPA: PadR family transcriptional regulator [Gemmatimonadaceae bacterium]|jgi:PadR family transcriptional regulator|nr:PadR family transcriptional regulator [Gemmatimonadaceae bacterium]
MPSPRRLSPAAVAVLQVIARGVRHGFDIMDATGLPSGTVYPILGRLERAAFVRSRWESPTVAQREKRPPRRNYEISGAGSRALAEAVEHYRTLSRGGRGTPGLAPKPQRT